MRKLLTVVPAVSLESQNFVESDPKQRIKTSLKQLAAQAERINLLSAELERSIWEFQAIATQVNEDSRFVRVKQRQEKRFQICEYRSVYLPIIRQKSGSRFLITSRYLALSQPRRKIPAWMQSLRRWLGIKATEKHPDLNKIETL
jgi:hypothetical protein